MTIAEPLLGSNGKPLSDEDDVLRLTLDSSEGHAWRPAKFLERQLGTDQQLALFFMSLAQAVGLAQPILSSFFPRCPDPSCTDPTVFIIDSMANILLNGSFLIGNMILFYALHPSRVLLNIGYDGGRTQVFPKSWRRRHFGTPLLAGSQFQVIACLLLLLGGIVEVIYIDCMVAKEEGSLSSIWTTTKDVLGWTNVIGGLLGTGAMYYFNRTCYPDLLLRPRSDVANWLDRPRVKRCMRPATARWLQVHLLSDMLVTSWLLTVACVLWLLGEIAVFDLWSTLQPAGYVVGSLFLLRFAYNEGTVLYPVLFGCHKTNRLPKNHPMGSMFNAPSTQDMDINACLDVAVAAMDQAASKSQAPRGMRLLYEEGLASILADVDVEMHAFALAQLLRSEEFRKEDVAVERVEVIASLGADAQILHVVNRANPPMPRSDQVVISAVREDHNHIIVAEWAVDHPYHVPSDRVVRDYPFQVFKLEPISPTRTHMTVYVVSTVASWMPAVLVSKELEKGAAELSSLQDLAKSNEGIEVRAAIQREVWKHVAQEMPAGMWDFFQQCAPEVKELSIPKSAQRTTRSILPDVAAPQRLHPLEDMSSLGVQDPLKVAAIALCFSNSDLWSETKVRMARWCRPSDHQASRIAPRIWKHKLIPCALCASIPVVGSHPMLLATLLQQPEFKRQSDSSIIELREVRKVSDFCSIFYQRSQFKGPLRDRDAVSASLLVDFTPDNCIIVEWPVQIEECPVIAGIHRSRSFFLYEIHRSRSLSGATHMDLTITAVVDLGGSLGSRWLRPVVNGSAVDDMVSSLGELARFFETTEGIQTKSEIENAFVREVCQNVRQELTPMQISFMETYSSTFAASVTPGNTSR